MCNVVTGDLCDSDIDGDGVDNGVDNCPYVSNANQADTNGTFFVKVQLTFKKILVGK